MKRFENALCAYAWAWKLVIAILWMLWATQMYGYVREDIAQRNAPGEVQASLILSGFVADEVEAIRQSKEKFLSAQYFETMKKIERKRLEIERTMHVRPYMPNVQMHHLRALVIDYKEMAENGNGMMYQDWLRGGGALGEEAAYKVQADGWLKTISMFANWLGVLYLRTIFLILALYAVRMAQRRGILETILAGKMECVKAVIVWPAYFLQYPYNIIREIRVEAELRRMGDVFRRLKTDERLLARAIADSGQYEQHLQSLRVCHKGMEHRSLLVALIPALVLYIVLPAFAGEGVYGDSHGRDGPVIMYDANDGPAVLEIVVPIPDAPECVAASATEAVVFTFAQMECPDKAKWIDRVKKVILKDIALKIDHVPI
ncbi:MAG: hypothetical protein ACD_81C00205G0001 [uncultured bacterium]|uniref:Uncharacterized protein n=1 Tax=Candidatus Wolfebacteria bacterium GW2011_GWC2_39_22 TaxID=1619013 RepID=A0A0G0N7L9_9BACT|nr:MAG: hypothetical protein ACD_81C00205G0001 [uncultured bacterium]KKR12139.1 MAG: hypothetical protein UT41_C0003G0066 [Candidatus Wolfebacteria bacterium GW2011_GWC2_39_22]HBI25240.1 hypothetical protein [Candidatus Wolfebacteria bacterium]